MLCTIILVQMTSASLQQQNLLQTLASTTRKATFSQVEKCITCKIQKSLLEWDVAIAVRLHPFIVSTCTSCQAISPMAWNEARLLSCLVTARPALYVWSEGARRAWYTCTCTAGTHRNDEANQHLNGTAVCTVLTCTHLRFTSNSKWRWNNSHTIACCSSYTMPLVTLQQPHWTYICLQLRGLDSFQTLAAISLVNMAR